MDTARELVQHAAARRSRTLDEMFSKQIVAAVGVPVVQEAQAFSVADAVESAEAMGYPVVVKLLSDEVPHKSELGAVRIGLGDRVAVADAAAAILDIAVSHGVTDRRLIIQQQLDNDLEIIVGTSNDPTFGPVVLVGIGGVAAEVLPDVQVRLAPVSVDEARRMIEQLRGIALLRGIRGRRGVDEGALAATVARLSGLAAALSESISSIDLNPLLVLSDGRPVAVDALVVLHPDVDEPHFSGAKEHPDGNT
jgi:succinyl-CoA synthetase beta subunit